MIWNYQSTGYCITMPQQILTDVKMITGGWFNHAALKEDGTLWTWGYNFSGNCGTDKATMIETPVQVAEDVQRVWTGLLNYSAKEDDITDMEEFGNDYVDNTIIEKQTAHSMHVEWVSATKVWYCRNIMKCRSLTQSAHQSFFRWTGMKKC